MDILFEAILPYGLLIAGLGTVIGFRLFSLRQIKRNDLRLEESEKKIAEAIEEADKKREEALTHYEKDSDAAVLRRARDELTGRRPE